MTCVWHVLSLSAGICVAFTSYYIFTTSHFEVNQRKDSHKYPPHLPVFLILPSFLIHHSSPLLNTYPFHFQFSLVVTSTSTCQHHHHHYYHSRYYHRHDYTVSISLPNFLLITNCWIRLWVLVFKHTSDLHRWHNDSARSVFFLL